MSRDAHDQDADVFPQCDMKLEIPGPAKLSRTTFSSHLEIEVDSWRPLICLGNPIARSLNWSFLKQCQKAGPGHATILPTSDKTDRKKPWYLSQ